MNVFKKEIGLFFSFFVVLTAFGQEADTLKVERFSVHGQTTIINQYKPGFTAKYDGENSLSTSEESTASITSTLFLGARLWKGASFFFNPEIAGGSGLSQVLGIADATNGETFRIGSPKPKIYLARMYYSQLFALTNDKDRQEGGFNELKGFIPTKYLAFTVGKVSLADFFDINQYSHDPRTQFMNWGLMSNGAWDYPANTRGYAPSFITEYVTPKNEFRYAISLMPVEANGLAMNWNVSKSNSSTFEYTRKYNLFKRKGAFRVLGFFTMGKMANYNETVSLYPINPATDLNRRYGSSKYGFGVNAEQELTDNSGMFFRASWNDGHTETWAFTEIDRSISLGYSLKGSAWNREKDVLGIAYVGSGISKPHVEYLKAGGDGFMLGDGTINYAWEHVSEVYYAAELVKDQMYLTGGYQFLLNPGYNKDRQGPVNVFSVRLHIRL